MVLTMDYCNRNRQSGSGNNFKVTCPDCNGHNLYITLGNGLAFCFNCFISYTLEGYERNTKKKIQQIQSTVTEVRNAYRKLRDVYQERMTKEHIDFLQRRGIAPEITQEFGVGFCPEYAMREYDYQAFKDAGVTDFHGYPSLGNRLVFPYEADGDVTDLRGRTWVGEEPKYRSPFLPSVIRGAWYPFNWDRAIVKAQEHKVLIITEGEIKAIAADHLFPIVALPGMNSWRRGLVPDPSWRVIVLFDNDARRKNRLDIDRAIRRVSERIPRVHVATLPLLGEQKMDIDAFLIHPQGNERRFTEIVQDAIPYAEYAQLRRF